MSVDSDWKNSGGATERVRDLLVEAGVPLELSVEAECLKFSDASSKRTGAYVDTRKLAYSSIEEPEVYREIDQMLDLYDELEVGSLGIQLVCNVPIECKHRRDVEYFAFPASSELAYLGFPVAGAIAGSQYAQLLESAHLVLKDRIRPASVALLKVTHGDTPQAVYSENVIYNSAGALYDFVAADLGGFATQALDALELEALDDLGVLPKLERIAETHGAQALGSIRQYARELPTDSCDRYNASVYGDSRVYHSVTAYMPIVCVGGPLHAVQWSPDTGIGDFPCLDACLVEIRKRGWPGNARASLLSAGALGPVLVTNLAGLPSCLGLAEDWFTSLRMTLADAPVELVRRWPLESALMSVGILHYSLRDTQPPYRSDLVY